MANLEVFWTKYRYFFIKLSVLNGVSRFNLEKHQGLDGFFAFLSDKYFSDVTSVTVEWPSNKNSNI